MCKFSPHALGTLVTIFCSITSIVSREPRSIHSRDRTGLDISNRTASISNKSSTSAQNTSSFSRNNFNSEVLASSTGLTSANHSGNLTEGSHTLSNNLTSSLNNTVLDKTASMNSSRLNSTLNNTVNKNASSAVLESSTNLTSANPSSNMTGSPSSLSNFTNVSGSNTTSYPNISATNSYSPMGSSTLNNTANKNASFAMLGSSTNLTSANFSGNLKDIPPSLRNNGDVNATSYPNISATNSYSPMGSSIHKNVSSLLNITADAPKENSSSVAPKPSNNLPTTNSSSYPTVSPSATFNNSIVSGSNMSLNSNISVGNVTILTNSSAFQDVSSTSNTTAGASKIVQDGSVDFANRNKTDLVGAKSGSDAQTPVISSGDSLKTNGSYSAVQPVHRQGLALAPSISSGDSSKTNDSSKAVQSTNATSNAQISSSHNSSSHNSSSIDSTSEGKEKVYSEAEMLAKQTAETETSYAVKLNSPIKALLTIILGFLIIRI
ncbi:hypothetical protein DFH28DRAFT_1224367 [Melampsora americana]|nr:hypothetical protein DFH28DRAFT_1224367 [Melampsora americana]